MSSKIYKIVGELTKTGWRGTTTDKFECLLISDVKECFFKDIDSVQEACMTILRNCDIDFEEVYTRIYDELCVYTMFTSKSEPEVIFDAALKAKESIVTECNFKVTISKDSEKELCKGK